MTPLIDWGSLGQFFDFFRRNFNINFASKAQLLDILVRKPYENGIFKKHPYNFSTMKKNSNNLFNLSTNLKIVLIVLALYGAILLVTYLVW